MEFLFLGFSDEEANDGKKNSIAKYFIPFCSFIVIIITSAYTIFACDLWPPCYSILVLESIRDAGKKKGKGKKKKKLPSRPPSPVYIEVQVSE